MLAMNDNAVHQANRDAPITGKRGPTDRLRQNPRKKKRCHPGSAFTNPLFAYPSSTSHNASSSASLNKPAG
ncbi:hypothetical protein [Pseudomonas chlororaphis]|uniref:hypothetical protein n=1 Tax=Pseudomonas chlororaphis TaxID=587753 RepID=UPI0013DD92E3|nr:hypothetical protein [Pseudomonas chlororaphis]